MVRFNEDAILIARFYADSDYVYLNTGRFARNSNSNLEITWKPLRK